MNKQQLASKIWESANKMRSKIEANEYKDYILGFIFYKYLSDTEVKFCGTNDFSANDIKTLSEDDTDTVSFIQKGIGYFIAYDNLFSTWVEKGKDFSVDNVRVALSAFSRLINATHRKVFDRILNTLETGLSKLGENASAQTKAISDLIQLIKAIPMDGKQDYDVLGFIYEYLIGMFAANAGKKAGEFYTPHEVSLLMSEIVADHVKDRGKIKIYDPTSGSGSLLINIGRSAAKHIDDKKNIKYYAQEIKENTYNLTRMNLVMRGILPDNIVVRNGDTLEEDWPYFEDNDPIGTYNPLYVDAVVSNPPYSQAWEPLNKETDPRYARFGLAPKTKADFAFLLHDLFHLKPDGIMTIVLPHGVLFRGGEEGEIRKNLIEQNHIDAIIGLPANIFFGTGIPTIIVVLKKKRPTTDVLIIDASKGFAKAGKNNVLRASDIKKIADTVIGRPASVDKFSRLVSQDEIRKNEYNLNIPRYVDSSESAETWDIYASMFGGIPKSEIALLEKYWKAFPRLKTALFSDNGTPYCGLATEDIEKTVKDNSGAAKWKRGYEAAFADFERLLKNEFIAKMMTLNISKEEAVISEEIFKRLANIALVDKYNAFQALDDEWTKTAVDLEILQTEGFEAAKKVDPNMVLKKKDGKDHEVQDGYIGHVIPFGLVQSTLLYDEAAALRKKEERLSEIASAYEEIIDSLSEEEKENIRKDDSENEEESENETSASISTKDLKKRMKEIMSGIKTPEIISLTDYLAIDSKPDKLNFIASHSEVQWQNIEQNKDGTYTKGKINAYIKRLQSEFYFEEETDESKIARLCRLLDEETQLKKQVKSDTAVLHLLTKKTIERLTDEQATELLEEKWIKPLLAALHKIPGSIISDFVSRVRALADKYATTYAEVAAQIAETKSVLSGLIDDLSGNEFDMKGLSEFQALLWGDKTVNIKKAMLEKMFPKYGEDKPEIRFAGFTDAWEQRKLGEHTKLITKGTTPKDKSGIGEVNFVKVENIANGVITPVTKITIAEHDGDLQRSKLKENDVLFSIAGTLGRIAIVDKSILPANTNQALAIIRDYDFNTDFLLTSLLGKAVASYIRKNPTIGAQPNLSLGQVSDLDICAPQVDEQRKIGTFFATLDRLITLHQRELTKLQNVKKSLLEKMFPPAGRVSV